MIVVFLFLSEPGVVSGSRSMSTQHPRAVKEHHALVGYKDCHRGAIRMYVEKADIAAFV